MDQRAEIKGLLAEGRWLRRLAQSLVDAAAAEDVLQETYAAAISVRPRSDRPLRPWLATVLRNFARLRRRAQGRRAHHEGRALEEPSPPVPTPEELLGERQQHRLIAAAVASLEEPYRSTLRLCYADGLTPSEIARRQGVPPATVRARLRRGLARARAWLDDQHDRQRAAWAAPLGRFAEAAVPPRASAVPVIDRGMRVAASKATTRSLIGSTLVSALAGAGLLLLVGGVGRIGAASRRVHGRPAEASATSNAGVNGRPGARSVFVGDAPRSSRRALAPLVGEALPALLAAAREADGAPTADERTAECIERREKLQACRDALADGEEAGWTGTPEEKRRRRDEWLGRFDRSAITSPQALRVLCTNARNDGQQERPTRAQLAEARGCWAIADCAGALACSQALAATSPPPADFAPSPGPHPAAVAGRVIDPRGAPLPHIRVLLESRISPDTLAAFTDQEGRFSFPPVAPGTFSLFADRPGLTPPQPIDVAAGASVNVEIALREPLGDPL